MENNELNTHILNAGKSLEGLMNVLDKTVNDFMKSATREQQIEFAKAASKTDLNAKIDEIKKNIKDIKNL